MPAQKSELRKLLKNRWLRISGKLRSELENNACRQIINHPYFKDAYTVFLYAGDSYDLNLFEIMRVAPEKNFAFPEVISKTEIIFRQVQSYSDLKPGKFNILTPPIEAPVISPERADLVIVPAQAADSLGYRLGRGGGFYDRFLMKTGKNTRLLCVVPFFARFSVLPVESYDHPVHDVIVAVI